MDNQTLHETVGAFAYDLFETGDRIGEQLKDIYLLAIQMDCFPSPEKCDSRERMIKSLERLEGYLYDKTKELRSEANWLGKMQVRVIKVLKRLMRMEKTMTEVRRNEPIPARHESSDFQGNPEDAAYQAI